MEAPRLERKLVAILAADVEGYSRHMERDEAATLATLSAHRMIVDDLINSHNGRITGTAGDSVLRPASSNDVGVKRHKLSHEHGDAVGLALGIAGDDLKVASLVVSPCPQLIAERLLRLGSRPTP